MELPVRVHHQVGNPQIEASLPPRGGQGRCRYLGALDDRMPLAGRLLEMARLQASVIDLALHPSRCCRARACRAVGHREHLKERNAPISPRRLKEARRNNVSLGLIPDMLSAWRLSRNRLPESSRLCGLI